MDGAMHIFTLKRTHFRDDGTFSVFDDEGRPFTLCVEPPKNSIGRYLIPPGEYICKRIVSPKFGNTFEITGVIGHDHVEFHWGNVYLDTHACVVVGEKFGILNNLTAIQESRTDASEGFNEFLERTKNLTQFKLVILNAF